ncbi:hypothetical protein ACJ41O_001019 [Fusarium nematophilum]
MLLPISHLPHIATPSTWSIFREPLLNDVFNSSGHMGRFGHEFLEFDFRVVGDGRSAVARYANNSNYRNDSLIRKEMCVSSVVVDEIKRIIKTSEITKEDDSKWPQKNKDGRQELEIRIGNDHIAFEASQTKKMQRT